MKPRVVLTYPFHKKVIKRELMPFAQVRIARTPKELKRELGQADALITCFLDKITPSLLKSAPKLKAIGNVAVGFDNIDLNECQKRGIRVTNTPGVLTRATAELTLALLLSAARRIPEGEQLCRSGRFRGWRSDMLLGIELKGRNAVLVGKGRIGQETAKLFRGIGLQVEWITRKESERQIVSKLKRAQILSFHVPLTQQTHHWLNAKRLGTLPKDAIVINTTRGPVVDEKALIRALRKRRIFAAGLDVFEREPEIPAQLRRLPNVVLLPHIGSATESARQAMVRLAVQGVLAILSGKHPRNEVKFRKTRHG